MPSTGQICTASGIYKRTCPHPTEIALSVGEKFPPCPDCNEAVNWSLVRATN